MATRSSISIKTKKGGKTIYCHWDGYPSNNGKILLNHYKTAKRVKELIALGNISVLDENIGVKVEFDGFDSSKTPQCLAYGRDRGETEQEASSFTDLPTDIQGWNYLFENGKWYVSEDDEDKYVPLTSKFIKEADA